MNELTVANELALYLCGYETKVKGGVALQRNINQLMMRIEEPNSTITARVVT